MLFRQIYSPGSALLLAATIFLLSVSSPAATRTVTKTADTNDGVCNGDCSLREAIGVAVAGDTVVFSSVLFSTSQTITLVLGELAITKNLIITGPAPRLLTVSANNAGRVMVIGGPAGTTVSMSGFTIANGNLGDAGAGIYVNTGVTLSLNRLIVRNNTGTFGGGIFNGGTITIAQSSVTANHATAQSGGMQNNGTATIMNSTFSGNTSANNGGGILDLGQTNLINTTISRNRANVAGGFLKVSGGAANIRNTIIAGNTSGNGDPRYDVNGPFTSQGNNLIGNSQGSTGFTNGVNADKVGSFASPVDPLLAPLMNCGGSTDTMALIYPSPALSAGNGCVRDSSCGPVNNPPTALTTDQRGLSRLDGPGIDIGAVENSYFTVSTTADAGPGTLRQAAGFTQASIITIAPTDGSCTGGVCTINLTSGEVTVNGAASIIGAGARSVIIQRSPNTGTSNFRVFNFSGGSSGSLNGLTIRNGRMSGSGGAVLVGAGSEVYLNGVAIKDNVGRSGGGIHNAGILTVADSTISNNTAASVSPSLGDFVFGGFSDGGGIVNYGKLNIRNSTISNNTSMERGGGIHVAADAEAYLNNVTIANNSAASGGGVYGNSEGVIELRNTLIALNTATVGPDVNGLITSRGNNLIRVNNGDAAPAFPAGNPNANGDRVGTSSSPMDPLLGPLANNGGATDTLKLLSQSPALNTGNNCVVNRSCPNNNPPFALVNDQRGPGFGRRQMTNVDIGAYEAGNKTPFDFDGDGKTDIGIFRPGDGTWWVQRSTTGVTFVHQFGVGTDRIAPADFTGDGKTDHAIFRPSNGNWFVLRSEDFSFFAFPFGQNGDIPTPADYDNDGKADAAVFRPSTGVWFIQRSGDGGVTIQQFGSPGDVPVAGDYDGDGRADLAIFRPSNGQWWLNRTTAGVVAVTFGNASDKPTAGDFTGDGKADVTIWRPSTGEWFVLRSEDFSYFAFPFGTNGDIVAAGDYDGDGKWDPAVFRPSNATWYLQQSTSGVAIRQFGATGDRPVPNAFVP